MGVPVLCSSECGAECIGSENGLSLPSDEKLSTWVGNAEKIISENYRINYEMSWEQVASKYIRYIKDCNFYSGSTRLNFIFQFLKS